MIECREKRDFGENSSRQRLKTWILFSSSIVNRVIHSMRHDDLSSKVQAAATDVFDRMWTCARDAIGIMLHSMSIEYEAPVNGSCVEPVSWDATSASNRPSMGCGMWRGRSRGRSRILSEEQLLGTYVAPFALSTGFRCLFRHSTTSAVNLLLFVPFATSSCNDVCQHEFRSLLSISKHCKSAWEKSVCNVQSRCLRD